MIVSELISADIFPLKKTDTCAAALLFMQDWKVSNLPVVEGGKLLGYVSAQQLNQLDEDFKIEQWIQPLVQLFSSKSDHIFQLYKQFSLSKITCIAVCDHDNNYEGAVSINDLTVAFGHSSIAQPGAIITLKMSPMDYSLAEIARVIEYNDCKIVNVFIQADPVDATKILVSLKLNKQSVSTTIQTLERYQYMIFSVHDAIENNADLNNRYDWLIKYLNT